ncbi:MAG TPA: nucleotidyltransferase family protein, partial [Methylomirabilota bacterium]|nr:nucleotidyltransferase family protein [Methylomirabilota bacterium]
YAAEARRIAAEARRRALPLVSRKGLVFERALYGGRGLRAFDDLDFMTLPAHGPAVADMLRALGFDGGKVDRLRGETVPHDRRRLVTYRLAPDHLPPFTRPAGDAFVTHVEVDVSLSFTWWGSEYDVPQAEAFATVVPVATGDGEDLPAFSPAYQFVDAALHLFREAFVEMPFQDRGNAVKLRSFLDVRLLVEGQAGAEARRRLRETVHALGIVRPVAWVLTHVDRVFDSRTLDALGLHGAISPDWAAGWRRMGGELAAWHGDMRRRLAEGGAVALAGAGAEGSRDAHA